MPPPTLDLTSATLVGDIQSYLVEHHAPALSWLAAYVLIKLVIRLYFGRGKADTKAMSLEVWDPTCLLHNVASVLLGLSSLVGEWKDVPASATCGGLSSTAALVILLQLAHSISDFVVFLPEMLLESVFIWHHAVLIVVSLVLPRCQGCMWTVIAFIIAELGSASIAVDAEWRRAGGSSRGFKRVVVFGLSRVVNLLLLHQIYLVTPTRHIFSLADSETGDVVFRVNVPVCMIVSVGGSAMMLCVNGITWWRMWKAYLRMRVKRGLDKKKD